MLTTYARRMRNTNLEIGLRAPLVARNKLMHLFFIM